MNDTLTDIVELAIPCRPEYVGVARLAILGIASRMPFSYDEVEDVRLAVGEACTHAVERAGDVRATISITTHVSPAALIIDVDDDVREDARAAKPKPALTSEENYETDADGLGALLMEILVDEVHIDSRPTGTHVRLTKYAPD